MAMNQNVFLHETDRAAMDALKAIPGFSQVTKAFMSGWSEKMMYMENLASYVRRLLLIANRSRSNKRRNELMNPYIGLMIYGFILFRMIRLSNDACMLSVLTVNTMDLHSFF